MDRQCRFMGAATGVVYYIVVGDAEMLICSGLLPMGCNVCTVLYYSNKNLKSWEQDNVSTMDVDERVYQWRDV